MIQIIKPVLKVSFSTGCEIKGHLQQQKNYKIIYVFTIESITAKSTDRKGKYIRQSWLIRSLSSENESFGYGDENLHTTSKL